MSVIEPEELIEIDSASTAIDITGSVIKRGDYVRLIRVNDPRVNKYIGRCFKIDSLHHRNPNGAMVLSNSFQFFARNVVLISIEEYEDYLYTSWV